MKRFFLILPLITVFSSVNAQQFDSLSTVVANQVINDVAYMDNTMFAAMGDSGVYKSTDEGITWTACAVLPDAGFGQEGAFALFAASNGELIVGANTLYNGAALTGVVYRSTDKGGSWTQTAVSEMGGYESAYIILELDNGDLIMQTTTSKIYKSSLTTTDWTQVTSPGGVIFGFNSSGNRLYLVNNPAGGTAGTWYSDDSGTSWARYGVNGTKLNLGTTGISPILTSSNYKFIGIGGTGADKGVYRSGLNDTLWTQENGGLTDNYIYPTSMATDDQTVWMIYEGINQCYLTSTTDFGDNWTTPVGNQPKKNGGTPLCMSKLFTYSTHLYSFINDDVYRIANVAKAPTAVNEIESENKVLVYPNPSQGLFSVNSKEIIKSISIYNLLGKQVFFKEIHENDMCINLEHLPKGMYVINLTFDAGSLSKRLVMK